MSYNHQGMKLILDINKFIFNCTYIKLFSLHNYLFQRFKIVKCCKITSHSMKLFFEVRFHEFD